MPYATGCHDCGGDATGPRCEACRRRHNAKEAARRAERKAAGRCTVCGAKGARVNGGTLTVCPTHREYYAARARAS